MKLLQFGTVPSISYFELTNDALYLDGPVQDGSISTANVLEILQSTVLHYPMDLTIAACYDMGWPY